MGINIINIEDVADLACRMLSDIDPEVKKFQFATAVLYSEEAGELCRYFASLERTNIEYLNYDSMNQDLYYVSIDSDNSLTVEPAAGRNGDYRQTASNSVYIDVNAPVRILPSIHSDAITEIDFFCRD